MVKGEMGRHHLPVAIGIFLKEEVRSRSRHTMYHPTTTVQVSATTPIPTTATLYSPTNHAPTCTTQATRVHTTQSHRIRRLQRLTSRQDKERPRPTHIRAQQRARGTLLPSILPNKVNRTKRQLTNIMSPHVQPRQQEANHTQSTHRNRHLSVLTIKRPQLTRHDKAIRLCARTTTHSR